MNNKGFAVTTIVYTVLVLLSLVMLFTLGILKGEYDNQKTFITDINDELTECLNQNKC